MRFPKYELDIDQYMQIIKDLLVSEDCHLFIDTNIISQLYKLNDDARADFFNWVSTVSNRFHIPSWVVHEYQKRYVGQKTKDYLTELENGDVVKRLKNLSTFAKGYIGDSLLVGSVYQGKKDDLFQELEDVAKRFEKIHNAITKKLNEHQLKVHSDIYQNLQPYTLPSDVYGILKNIDCEGEIRYNHLVPPGYRDNNKDENRFGDLIIWKEILECCGKNDVAKAIWITCDAKPDVTYTPQKQNASSHVVNDGKIGIAHESLVFEFSQVTNSEEFYIINFMTLVKLLASSYPKLAVSFQIVTTPQQDSPDENVEGSDSYIEDNTTHEVVDNNQQTEQVTQENNSEIQYSERALSDIRCEDWCDDPHINLIIKNLKTYNWYKQNVGMQYLTNAQLTIDPSTVHGRDMIFVLGRNIYQSAVGAANEAIIFIENLNVRIGGWDKRIQQALVDGMLYEVFFNSNGEIRPKEFKANRYHSLLKQIDLLGLNNPYDFINSSLIDQASVRFVPEVHTNKRYLFEFEYDKDKFRQALVKRLIINGEDASTTFAQSFRYSFAVKGELIEKLSLYYAIPQDKIEVFNMDEDVSWVYFIDENTIGIGRKV